MKFFFLSIATSMIGLTIALCSDETQNKSAILQNFAPPLKKPILKIDPKLRAADYLQVFEVLRKEKPIHKIQLKLTNGTIISNIIDMSLMPNSTVFLLRFNTSQGIKLQAIELEQVLGLGYQE